MKFRIKVICPECRQERSALYDHRAPGRAKFYTHRVQAELAEGEKPRRCAGTSRIVRLAGRPVKAAEGLTPVQETTGQLVGAAC